MNIFNRPSKINAKLDWIIAILDRIGTQIMATQADIDALTAQVDKIDVEVKTAAATLSAEIAKLQAIIDAGQPVLDLSALQAAVTALDNLNPDAPAV